MRKPALAAISLMAVLVLPSHTVAGSSPFSCRLRETEAFLPQLSTFSGYRWIECRVLGAEAVDVDGVSINNGNCATFDNWFAGRRFDAAQPIYIPYACMSPVTVAIAANGVIAKMRVRSR
jgi:hypothetical protein